MTNLTIGQTTADELYSFAQANYSPAVMGALIATLGFDAFLEGAKDLMKKQEAKRMAEALQDFYPSLNGVK